MSNTIPHYWQHRIDDLRDRLIWALAEGDSHAVLAHFAHYRALFETCPEEYRRAVKAALLAVLWETLPADEKETTGD
jgi:hypothetical protein